LFDSEMHCFPSHRFIFFYQPFFFPATAFSLLYDIDSVCKSIHRAKSKTLSIGAFILISILIIGIIYEFGFRLLVYKLEFIVFPENKK
jgi:hypothetical protein